MDEDACGDVIVLPLYASLPPDQQVSPPQLTQRCSSLCFCSPDPLLPAWSFVLVCSINHVSGVLACIRLLLQPASSCVPIPSQHSQAGWGLVTPPILLRRHQIATVLPKAAR